ncbi:MAG: YggT family protein [Pseudomonadota bacterium]
MGGYFGNAGVFLVNLVFGFFIAVLLLRVLLQLVRANFFNPVCQFLVKITNPVLMPLRRIIPNWGRVELSAILLAWVLKSLQTVIVLAILGSSGPALNIVAIAAVELLDLVITIFLVVIFIRVILSWVAPQGDNPVLPLLYQLSAPILNPARRVIPLIGGLDLSPVLAIVVLQLARMLVVAPLMDLARAL